MGLASALASLFGKKKKKKSPRIEDGVDDIVFGDTEGSAPETMDEAIKEWQETIKIVQAHPLSQVKILNTRILYDLTRVMEQMNLKLDKLEELDKLDMILELLRETRGELKKKGVEEPKLDLAIRKMETLTLKDNEIIDWIAKKGNATAIEVAEQFGLSRSTISFRLNRLADKGKLVKFAEGKRIYFSVPTATNMPTHSKITEQRVESTEQQETATDTNNNIEDVRDNPSSHEPEASESNTGSETEKRIEDDEYIYLEGP